MQPDASAEIAVVRDWYDETVASFASRYTGTEGQFWHQFEETLALEMLGPVDGSILDLGCGTGRLASSLAPLARSVIGADVSPAMVLYAEASPHPANVRYCVMDATRAAFGSNTFGAVVSLGMFEYMKDPSPFLREILRLLRPGGKVVFTSHTRAILPMRVLQLGESFVRGTLETLFARSSSREVRRGVSFHPVEHKPKDLLSLLAAHGFVRAAYRGFHFLPAVDLFHLSARIGLRGLASAGRNAAVAMDRRVGSWRATRDACALTMYAAEKPAQDSVPDPVRI